MFSLVILKRRGSPALSESSTLNNFSASSFSTVSSWRLLCLLMFHGVFATDSKLVDSQASSIDCRLTVLHGRFPWSCR